MEVGLEEERLQQEAELNQKDNEEEVQHTNREECSLSNYWDRKPCLSRDAKNCFKFMKNNPQMRKKLGGAGLIKRLL